MATGSQAATIPLQSPPSTPAPAPPRHEVRRKLSNPAVPNFSPSALLSSGAGSGGGGSAVSGASPSGGVGSTTNPGAGTGTGEKRTSSNSPPPATDTTDAGTTTSNAPPPSSAQDSSPPPPPPSSSHPSTLLPSTNPNSPPRAPLAAISENEDGDGDADSEEEDADVEGEGEGEGDDIYQAEDWELGRQDLNKARTVKAGYLMKKGERRKAWQKRYFVLRQNNVAYYKNEKEYKILRIIPLSEIHTSSSIESKKHENLFSIVTPSRAFYIKAKTRSEMNDWVDKIESTRLELRRRELEERSIVSSAGTGADTPTPTSTVRNAAAGGGVDIPGSSRALTPGSFLASVGGGGGGGSMTSAPLASPNTTQLSSSMTSSDAGSSIGPSALPLSSSGSGFSSVALGLSTGGGGGGGREPSLSGSEISPLPGQRSVRKGSFGGGQSSGGEYFGNEAGGRPLSPAIVSSSEDEDYYEELEGGNELGGGGGGGTLPGGGGGGVNASRPTLSQQHSTSGTTGGGSGSAFSFPSAELMPPATQAAASLRSPGGKILSLSGTSAAGMTPGGSGGNAGSGGAGSLDANRVIMQGYLMKQGKRKNWRKRWFVLLGERLVYSRSHLDNKIRGQVPLIKIVDAIEAEQTSNTSLSRSPIPPPHAPLPPSPGPGGLSDFSESGSGIGIGGINIGGKKVYDNCFKIITMKRTYLVCAPSEKEELQWLSALQVLLANKRKSGSSQGNATSPRGTAGGAGAGGLGAGISLSPPPTTSKSRQGGSAADQPHAQQLQSQTQQTNASPSSATSPSATSTSPANGGVTSTSLQQPPQPPALLQRHPSAASVNLPSIESQLLNRDAGPTPVRG